MRRAYLPLLLLPLAARTANGQETDVRKVIAGAQPQRYEQPACGIKSGHFKVGSGATYLSTAINNATNRERLLRDAVAVLSEAILQNGQANNPAAWFYLGRVYLYQGDVVGADTAMTRAEVLAPACKDEILGYRRSTATALLAPAGLLLQAEKADSAIAVYRLAVIIHPHGTQAAYTVATVFEGASQSDSAIAYYRRVIAAAPDGKDRYAVLARPRLASLFAQAGQVDSAVLHYQASIDAATAAGDVEARNRSTFAMGLALYNAQRYAEAIPILRKYIEWRPDVNGARQALANAYRSTGQVDSAEAVMRDLGAATGAAAPDTTSASYLIGRGATRYQAGDYDKAAEDFEKAVEREPNNHTALRNLAFTYFQLKNARKLAGVAAKLVALEPLNEGAHRLENQAYIWLNDRTRLGQLAPQLDAMTLTIDEVRMQPTAAGAGLSGTISGRGAVDARGTAIPPAALVVVFEFLDAGGAVVNSSDVNVPALAPGASTPLSVEGQGSGIVSWRYRKK